MEQEKEYRQRQLETYKRQLTPLLRYLPWLEKSAGSSVSENYRGPEMGTNSLAFPVYDSTLMSLIRELGQSDMMDRNYQYVYTRNHIRNHDDERRLIQNAELKDWGVLCGILSRYVLGGRTKGTLWNEAVQERIFYLIVCKMRDLIEFWDKSQPEKA